MFILETLEDAVYIMRAEPGWDNMDKLTLFYNTVSQVLSTHTQGNQRCILIYKVRSDFETPYSIYMRTISFLLSIRQQIQDGLDKTVIWLDSDSVKGLLNMLLTIYTPTRPLKIYSTKEEVFAELPNISTESKLILEEA